MKSLLLSFLLIFSSSSIYGQTVETLEYFWDVDPGEGNGISASASDGIYNQKLEKISESVSTSALTEGIHTLFTRIKNKSGVWSLPVGKSVSIQADNIPDKLIMKSAEYFWDTDPGEGNGIAVLASDGLFDQKSEKISQSVSTSGLSNGVHVLFVRFQNATGGWSHSIGKTVNVRDEEASLPVYYNQLQITTAEYFWDTDPGEGNGVVISGTYDEKKETISLPVSTSGMSHGIHDLYVRYKDKSGNWSHGIGKRVLVNDPVFSQTVSYSMKKTKAAEFFLNTESGEGNGTSLAATDGTFDQIAEKLTGVLSTSSTEEGANSLFVRVQGVDGTWSSPAGKIITVRNNPTQPAETKYNIVSSAEYHIDSDPGLNNGVPFKTAASNNLKNFADTLNTSGLSIGVHSLYSRVKLNNGTWSPSLGKSFRVFDATSDILLTWENQNVFDSLSTALNLLGYQYDEWNRSDGNVPYRHWKTVIWDENDNLVSAERDSLKSFLSAGNENSLLIAGNEIATYHRKSGSQQDTIFMEQYLHAKYVSNDIMGATNTFQITGDLINNSENLEITSSNADGVRPINGAQAAFHYPSPIKADTVAGVAFGNSNFNVVYFPFAWNETNNISHLLKGSLNWIASEGATLPVEMSDLSYSINGNQIILNWETKTETNNYGWEIEEGKQIPLNPPLVKGETNGVSGGFRKIGFVSGKGTTTEKQNYVFTFPITNYAPRELYRLKQIDLDGTFSYSNTIEIAIEIPDKFSLEQNYPNPFNPTTVIGYHISTSSKVELKIFDLLGREVKTLNIGQNDAGKYSVSFDGSGFTSGVYFYQIIATSESGSVFTETKKMLMMK